ncbi:DMT family transporter [Psittacicella hinzii]|nr:DMT family transporter [Psittacicella hinzii]
MKEKTSLTQIAVVIMSLVGAVLIIKPSFNNTHIFAYGVGIFSALCTAFTFMAVRRLTTMKNGEHLITVECNLGTTICIVCLEPMIMNFQDFEGQGLNYLFLFIASIFSVVEQYTFTYALRYAPAVETSIYSYSSLIWNMLFGLIFFASLPNFYSSIGYVLIVAAGIILFYYNKQKLKVMAKIRRMAHEEYRRKRAAKQMATAQAIQEAAQTVTPEPTNVATHVSAFAPTPITVPATASSAENPHLVVDLTQVTTSPANEVDFSVELPPDMQTPQPEQTEQNAQTAQAEQKLQPEQEEQTEATATSTSAEKKIMKKMMD